MFPYQAIFSFLGYRSSSRIILLKTPHLDKITVFLSPVFYLLWAAGRPPHPLALCLPALWGQQVVVLGARVEGTVAGCKWGLSTHVTGELFLNVLQMRCFHMGHRCGVPTCVANEVSPHVSWLRCFQTCHRWGVSTYVTGEVFPHVSQVRCFHKGYCWGFSTHDTDIHEECFHICDRYEVILQMSCICSPSAQVMCVMRSCHTCFRCIKVFSHIL